MSFLDDTYCQLCERFITKEHLHKKGYGYTPAYFPNRRLIGDEANILEKAFWKKFLQLEILRN